MLINRNLLLAALAWASLSACGALFPGARRSDAQRLAQYFIHGDPRALIEGATLNLRSFIDPSSIASLQGFHLSSSMRVSERSERRGPMDWAELEKENGTDGREVDADRFAATFQFREADASHYELAAEGSDLRLSFVLDDGRLQLQEINSVAVEMLHYSLKADGKAFSFLFAYRHPLFGQSIQSLVFASSADIEPMPPGRGDFAFLYGNTPLPWEAPPEIAACGKFSSQEQLTISRSLESWFHDPKVPSADGGAYPIRFRFESRYPPFSDLDHHCIALVSNYRLEDSESYAVNGITQISANFASKDIIDADLFVFLEHVGHEFDGTPSRVLMHELGHMLGLGHEFKTQFGLAKYPSVMGYEKGSPVVTERDFAAIRELYGMPLKAAE